MSDTLVQNRRPARPAFGRAGVKAAPKQAAKTAPKPLGQSQGLFASLEPQAEPRAETRAPARTTSYVEESGGFNFGRIFTRAFGVLGRNAPVFAALVALAAIPERALVYLVGADSPMAAPLSSLVLMFSSCALQPAVMHGALRGFGGERAQFGACAAAGLKGFFPVLGLILLTSLGLAGATLLLVVPGIMLALSWSVVVPVRVAENKSIRACFGRSAALARGHRWSILAMGFVLLLFVLVLGAALHLFWPSQGLVEFLAGNWLLRLVLTAVSAACMASLYVELCRVQEGGAPQELAAAFD